MIKSGPFRVDKTTCAGGRLRDIFEGGGEIVVQAPAQPGLYATIPAMTS